MFEIIFLIIISIYFLQSLIFAIGVQKKFRTISEDKFLTASVIVAARNEEENILECLESLDKLKYPKNKLEIIIVDDNSIDNTGKIIDDFIEGKNRFKKIICDKEKGKLKGKTNALSCGIEEAKGEIILTTDADCLVTETWAYKTASYYIKNVGMVNGFTTQNANNNFNGMQSVDFIYLLTIASSTINLGVALSCIGNNMSYLKKAYLEVGGYENLPFSVTEDFNLLMAIKKLKKYDIIYPMDKDTLVTSKACTNFKELYWQKKRWAVGGIDLPISGYLIFLSGFITYVFIFLMPFFFTKAILFLFIFKIVIDFILLYPVHSKLGILKNMKYFLTTQIYFATYVVIMTFVLIFNRKVLWKGREF